MRALIGIVLVLIALALIGWVSFEWGPDESSLNIETQQIEEDVSEMSESAKDLGQRLDANVGDGVDDDVDQDINNAEEDVDALDEDVDNGPATAEQPSTRVE